MTIAGDSDHAEPCLPFGFLHYALSQAPQQTRPHPRQLAPWSLQHQLNRRALYARLVSFTQNKVSIESVELGIYNTGNKAAEVFSAKGESCSLVWHIKTPLWTPLWTQQRRLD
ncbi:hypothetical protein DFJ43DRAFT_517118 [Lentinula guzmanii]|uniref:Uncharacterized protein n=1 Tax=Lentinula guzmanii TaxID=2804957 RepID=A0AA38JJV5_9AGAR|nr:hypothetical protein DFJ43DRAFT_517118 [Lentinula guzmanii]